MRNRNRRKSGTNLIPTARDRKFTLIFGDTVYGRYARIRLNPREYASIPLDKTQRVVHKVCLFRSLRKRVDKSLDEDAIRLYVHLSRFNTIRPYALCSSFIACTDNNFKSRFICYCY